MLSRFSRVPLAALLLAVGLTHAGLLAGYQPVGSDPDYMYRPYKKELAESLKRGTLPYWSDRFGLGVPLIAESHVAAFYPPNLVAYRLLDVETAYRLLMFLSYLGLSATTYAYARSLGITPWGAALSGLSFTLCGFQANHAVHEWAVNAVPFLPLNLLLADRLLRTGKAAEAAALALAIGLQISIGHFQTQWMTLALIVLTGLVRVRLEKLPLARLGTLALAIVWGFATAALTLLASAEMVRFTGFQRPPGDLGTYPFVPVQVFQTLLPRLFNGFRDGITDPFWMDANTTGVESCLIFGTVPLILMAVGFVSQTRDRMLIAWRWVTAGSLLLAMLPILAPSLFLLIARLPGFGTFRCPARYTLVTSLGAALLAGQAFDRGVSDRAFRRGLAMASVFGVAAFAWAIYWFSRPTVLARLPAGFVPLGLFVSFLTFLGAGLTLIVWKRGYLGPWGPFLITLLELGPLFYQSSTNWGRSDQTITRSPVFRRLAHEPRVGLVAGPLFDLPVLAGFTPAFAYTGIPAPDPNPWLLTANDAASFQDPGLRRLYRRYGVTHGIWSDAIAQPDSEVIYQGPDAWLDRTANYGRTRSVWRLVRYRAPFPKARVSLRERLIEPPGDSKTGVSQPTGQAPLNGGVTLDFDQPALKALTDSEPVASEVSYQKGDHPPDDLTAKSAKLVSWDGLTAVVEHDGACDLVVNRTYYPGWVAKVGGVVSRSPDVPVFKADGGLQAVRLTGRGTSRVVFRYVPTWLGKGLLVSGLATSAALLTLMASSVRRVVKAV